MYEVQQSAAVKCEKMINSNKVLKSVDTHESVAHISKSASKSAINELNNSGEKERCNLIDAIKRKH